VPRVRRPTPEEIVMAKPRSVVDKDYRARRAELRAALRPGNLARILAVKLESNEFSRLFEVLDHPDLTETLADEVARIETGRNPAELAPRRKTA
jgi:hypothetical protein